MTAKKGRLIPAVARLDAKPRKPTRQQQLQQYRRAGAWRKAQQGEERRDR
jgi:hypothetical protein